MSQGRCVRRPEAAGLYCENRGLSLPENTPMPTNLRTRIISPRIPRPVRFDWLARVAASGGTSKCLHLGLVLCWLAALAKGPGVRLGRRVLARYAISRDAAYDALKKLEAEKLIVVWRLPGRSHHVILLDSDGAPLNIVPNATSGAQCNRHFASSACRGVAISARSSWLRRTRISRLLSSNFLAPILALNLRDRLSAVCRQDRRSLAANLERLALLA